MNLPELQIGGIALAPVIVALIGFAKTLGLPSKYAPYVNGLLSVLAYLGTVLVGQYPGALEPTTLILNAVVIFLTAAGVYDIQKVVRRK